MDGRMFLLWFSIWRWSRGGVPGPGPDATAYNAAHSADGSELFRAGGKVRSPIIPTRTFATTPSTASHNKRPAQSPRHGVDKQPYNSRSVAQPALLFMQAPSPCS